MSYQPWYNPMQIPPQHQPPPHQPHTCSQMPHTRLPMSPRNPPFTLQGPSTTPALSHTITSPVHPPLPFALTHSSNGLLTSPLPTPFISGAPFQKRVRRKRGENRNEKNRVPGESGGQGNGSGFNNNVNQMQNLGLVVPLQVSEKRWDRNAIQVDQDSPVLVERKVKGLLNKLTMENFTSISDQLSYGPTSPRKRRMVVRSSRLSDSCSKLWTWPHHIFVRDSAGR